MLLITESYRSLQSQAHQDTNYGHASLGHAPWVSSLIDKKGITELLDYGAGKCRLFDALKTKNAVLKSAYDPAIPELSERPSPAELVCCIDVLEHIEPDCLDAVLDDLQFLTLRHGYFSVTCVAANRILADGRNAHLIQEPPEWWLTRLLPRFDIEIFQRIKHGFVAIVTAKGTATVDPDARAE